MVLPHVIENTLRLALLLTGLLLPGSMVLRALRLPWSLATAFVTSCTILYLAVLGLAFAGGTISLPTLAAAIGAVALAARLVPARKATGQLASSFACFSQMGWWLPLYLAFWVIVGYRLVAQPLSGPDISFRWSFLAEQMLRFHTIDFYPPRSGADFAKYFWAESIPPGIASLYAWAYACGGSKHALWTVPVVALQLLSLHEVIWRLGNRWGGEVVARRAVLLAAACPLLTWSALIGQETGQTALAVCGLVWCLQHLRDENGDGWAVLAATCAVAAASTREYGPAFGVTAVAAAAWQGGQRRPALILALVALPLIAAWPVRVWLLTGNPFYSLALGGLFPTNAVFVDWTEAFHAPHAAAFSSAAGWQALARYVGLWALPAVAGLLALFILLGQRLRETRAVALFVTLNLALWAWSVPHTAGGLFYSLRVLSPAFALLAVVASYGLGALLRFPGANRLIVAAVLLVSLEALPKTLVLPENPYRLAPADWPRAGGQMIAAVQAGEPALIAMLQARPGRERILSDNAGLPRVLNPIGSEVVPLWSPEANWLFDASLSPEEIARRWQKAGFRYVVLSKSGPTTEYLRTRARWRAPFFNRLPVTGTADYDILESTVTLPTPPP